MPKDKHGMKTLAAANKKYAKAKKERTKKKEKQVDVLQHPGKCGKNCKTAPAGYVRRPKLMAKSLTPQSRRRSLVAAKLINKITGADFKALKKGKAPKMTMNKKKDM
jgi:hypothetical protein